MRGVAGDGFGLRSMVARLVAVGLIAVAIAAGAPVTAAQAQGVVRAPAQTDTASRDWLRADIRAVMDRQLKLAEFYRNTGDCDLFFDTLALLRGWQNDGPPTRREKDYNITLTAAERQELIQYSISLWSKLPRDCPPRAALNEPSVEYVKICQTGFYYIPGTDTCVSLPRAPGSATAEGIKIEVGGAAATRRVTGNVQRIARDSGGTIFYDLGNEKQNGSGAGFNVGVRVPIGTQFFGQKSYLNFGYNYLRVTGDGSGGQASTANFISFPGLGVGANPNGFFAAGTMPFSYQYDFTQQRHGGEIAAGFEIEQGPVEFYPWAGVRFGSNSVEDTYSVSRPSPVPINATYMTDSNVNSLGIFVGLSVSVQPQGSPIELFTQGRVGVDSNWAKSDVSFNIVFPGTNETQQVSLSQQKFTPYLFLETGVKVKLGVVQATVSGFAEHGGYAPSISIPGGGVSPVLQGETETNYGGKFSVTARFN
jgi:hypothetical protein